MSQEKVDLHKAEKKNMKSTVMKKKAFNAFMAVILVVVAALAVAWIAGSAYRSYRRENPAPVPTAAVDISSLTDFNSDFMADEAAK